MVLDKYAKAVATLIVTAAVGLIALLPGNMSLADLSTDDWLVWVGAVIGSGAAVALFANIPGVYGGAIKSLMAGAGAAITSLHIALADGVVTQAEWLTAFTAFFGALGIVYQIKNKPG